MGLIDLTADSVLSDMADAVPTWWWTKRPKDTAKTLASSGINFALVEEARERLIRFAPWFMAHYPDSVPTGGILESPLQHEAGLAESLGEKLGCTLTGQLWFKRDDMLPVSGSVKARGGIHEVLEVAERIALDSGLLKKTDSYLKFDEPEIRELLQGHGITVGSTGNLGLSIGLVAAKLGFDATVHMSQDARAWKKDLLRSQGAKVVEHSGDFSQAVDAGRAAAEADESVHFVDDEGSLSLFSGYAVAAERLAGQLRSLEIRVDAEHPLFIYLPCGVGGAPGGLTYGLKHEFGEHVHCIFIEPVKAPAMSLGVRTGRHDAISAQDIGLDGLTTADGLAVSRPSRLVGEAVGELIDGFMTLPDPQFLAQLALLEETEGLTIEPSATAGMSAPWKVEDDSGFLNSRGISSAALSRANHILWFTGGSMVPQDEMAGYLSEGRKALNKVHFV